MGLSVEDESLGHYLEVGCSFGGVINRGFTVVLNMIRAFNLNFLIMNILYLSVKESGYKTGS